MLINSTFTRTTVCPNEKPPYFCTIMFGLRNYFIFSFFKGITENGKNNIHEQIFKEKKQNEVGVSNKWIG